VNQVLLLRLKWAGRVEGRGEGLEEMADALGAEGNRRRGRPRLER